MATIEQVSKRFFSDQNWLKKWVIGGLLLLFVLPSFFAFGYLYRLFQQGRLQQDFALPDWEWDNWRELLIDGLVFFLIGLLFAGLPIAVLTAILLLLPGSAFLAQVPLIPVYFLSGPLFSAALYLFQINKDFKDCFNFTALGLMLKKGASAYSAPTLAFIGLLGLAWVILPFVFFFGGVIYMYVMAGVYRGIEVKPE